jgi:hypothetical protein
LRGRAGCGYDACIPRGGVFEARPAGWHFGEDRIVSFASASALDGNVLVLNKHYAAIRVVSVRRAFSMLVRRMAEVISVDNDQYVSHDFDSWRDLSVYRAKYEREHHEWAPA